MVPLLAVVLAVSLAPALRDYAAGVDAALRGDAKAAVASLTRAAAAPLRSKPQALYLLARAELDAGRAQGALVRFDRLARAPSAVQGRALWGAAEAAWALGRTGEARRRYLEALRRAPDDGDAGVALFRAGENKRLAIERPEHVLAASVKPRLAPSERLARAKRLIQRLRWDDAIAQLDRLPGDEARYWAGIARYRTRHAYQEASAILLDVYARLPAALAADALFHAARAQSRADSDDEAIRLYREVVRRYPRSPEAPEAAFLAGWLEYNRGRFAAALAPLDDAARRFPKSRLARDARWHRAFALWLLGRDADAILALDAYAKGADGELDLGKALYWRARALERLGRGDEAAALRREIATRFPLSWYALLAQPGSPLLDASALPPLARSAKAESDALIAVADELVGVGLPDEASRALRRGETAFRARHGAAALATLLDRYRRASDWNRLYNLGDVHGDAALRHEPRGDARLLWEAAYPLAHRDLVEKYGPPAGNPEFYLYAIMRKESGFDARDHSYADARGLLQMIPATSRRVGEKIGVPYTDATLFTPEGNVRFGAWYIGRLFRKFRAQAPLAAASYNAGPKPVMRWCDERGGLPTDEFVERIPYEQTREYAKKVSAIYARYEYLYAGRVYQVPPKLDCRYAVDEIDY